MAESIVWNKKSIINMSKDTIIESEGSAVIIDKSLVLSAKSKARFSYTIDTGSKVVETSKLKFILEVINSNEEINSRYDESVQVEAYVYTHEVTKDANGDVSVGLAGHAQSYQINPYFKHEKLGYIDKYELDIENSAIYNVTIDFINMSENEVTFVNPLLYNSMTILNAIDEYGGQSGGGDTPPLIEDLTIYSLDDTFTIDKAGGELILQAYIPYEWAVKYMFWMWDGFRIEVRWTIENVDGSASISTSTESIHQPIDYTDEEHGTVNRFYIVDGRMHIKSTAYDGSKKIRVSLVSDTTVYAERIITITNNSPKDIKIEVDSPDGKIHGFEKTKVRLYTIPSPVFNYQSDIKIAGYGDNAGGALASQDINSGMSYNIAPWANNGESIFYVRGVKNGQVKLTTNQYGINKSFLLDVVDIPGSYVVLNTPDGDTIDNTKDGIQIKINTMNVYKINCDDADIYKNIRIETLDGNGDAVVEFKSATDNEIVLFIRPMSVGKVRFYIDVYEFRSTWTFAATLEKDITITGIKENPNVLFLSHPANYITAPNGLTLDENKEYIDIKLGAYTPTGLGNGSSLTIKSLDGNGLAIANRVNNNLFRVYALKVGRVRLEFYCDNYAGVITDAYINVDIDITGVYKPANIQVTSSNGDFIINNGGGQLRVDCTSDYNEIDDFSFSYVSVNGGNTSINDKGRYAIITADKNGTVKLKCTPIKNSNYVKADLSSLTVEKDIVITNQYPEDVQLVTASGEFKVALNGELTVFAEAGNNPNPNYDEYTLLKDILYPDSAITIVSGTKDWRLGGTGLGKVRIMARRSVDNSLMDSAVVKIVQTLDSDIVNLPFPNNYTNFILYRRANQGNKVWLVAIKDSISSMVLKSDKRVYTDISLSNYSDYYLSGASWKNYGNWGGNNCPGNNVTIIYAASVNVYDESGNIVVNASTYDEIDWNHVLYGE